MIDVLNPCDGSVVGTVGAQSSDAVAQQADLLRENQTGWAALTPRDRAAWLRKLRDWLLVNDECIADVLQSETGKPRAESIMEVPLAAEVINYYADNAAKFLTQENVVPSGVLSLAKKLTVLHDPYPVVGVITPWNFPLLMPVFDCVPALLAGASVLLKPSEITPLSALELARGWAEIGAPQVFSVVTGYGETGAAVIANSDYIQFTGSTATGKLIAHQAIDRMIPCSLELGGKDAAIVLDDADLDRAVPGVVWGALANAGQICVSIERVYVEAPIYDEFVARATDLVETLRQGGDGAGFAFDIGPMATRAQRERVEGHVNAAIAAGAKATTGGRAKGNFFEPTILVDVDHSMACIQEETFGPTIPIIKVADEAEAVRLANESSYGLSASVWTASKSRGQKVARQLEVGAVNINDALVNLFALSVPHGGWKSSGIGTRFGGAHGILKYTRTKAVTAARIPGPTRELLWYPYRATRLGVLRKLLRIVAGYNLRRLVRF